MVACEPAGVRWEAARWQAVVGHRVGGHCNSQSCKGCETVNSAGVGGLDRTNEPLNGNRYIPE